jgi:hypothetical protein
MSWPSAEERERARGDEHLVVGEHRLARSGEQILEADLTAAIGAGDVGRGILADERRHDVRGRSGIAHVAAQASAVLDLHAAEQVGRRGDRGVVRRDCGVARHARRAQCRADLDAALGPQPNSAKRRYALEIDDAIGAAAALAQLRQQIGATCQRARLTAAQFANRILDRRRRHIHEVPHK